MPLVFVALAAVVAGQQPQRVYSLADLQRFTLQVENAVKAAESWSVTSGKYVSVHFVGTRDPGLDRAVATLDEAAEGDCRLLNLTLPTAKIDVYLFPSAEELGHALGMGPVPEGISIGKWSALALKGSWNETNLGPVAAQQLGYALVHDQIGLFGWKVFNDGIGLYLRANAEQASWLNKPSPVEATRLTELVRSARSNLDAQEGAEFIGFLIRRDHGDAAKLKAVLTSLNEERLSDLRSPGKEDAMVRVDRAFTGTYGENLARLEHEWRAGV